MWLVHTPSICTLSTSLCISTKQTLNSLTKSFVGHAVDLDKKLNPHSPTRHTLNAMMRLSVVPEARPGREEPPRNTTSTPRQQIRTSWKRQMTFRVSRKNYGLATKNSLFRPKTTKETVPAPQGHPEVSRNRRRRARSAPSFFLLKRVRYLRQVVDLAHFLRYFFSAETLVSCLLALQRHEVIIIRAP